jgi:gamma-glutamyl hercynylcysteine S-oxide synthase
MRRYFPNTVDHWLLTALPLCLASAWFSGYWTLGSAAALTFLCVLAIRNPRSERLQHWTARLLRRAAAPPATSAPPAAVATDPARPRARRAQWTSLVEQLVDQQRVALLLRPQVATSLSAEQLAAAQEALDDTMAIVPEGLVAIHARSHENHDDRHSPQTERIVSVEGLFLDRFAVTCRDYLAFIDDGGYEQMSLWEEAMWPAVLGFLDRTGQPGPRFWKNGTFASGQGDHPVVGVSWYEASAFARWAGKRLPTDPEWIKAGSWPVCADGGNPVQRRYPWGDAMDRRKVNLWGSGFNGTVPVAALSVGASVNGVEQLVGNVWEWTSSAFGVWEPAGRRIETATPLKSIRGGAFDTYFETQAHCQFQSGENPLARKHNIGFRCALGFCDVVHMSGGTEPLELSDTQAAELEEVLS